ncbi:hypothetical protein D918_00325 [Trichuris suis]|nr:hypothetical protein D918_00325 [Trichuris suis]
MALFIILHKNSELIFKHLLVTKMRFFDGVHDKYTDTLVNVCLSSKPEHLHTLMVLLNRPESKRT